MRIVFSSPRFEPFLGGVETNSRECATRLAARGHDVAVVTTDPVGDLPTHENYRGVEVIRIRSWPRRGDPFLAPQSGKSVLTLKPELIHVQSYQTMFSPFVMREAVRSGVPSILAFHGGVNSNSLRQALYPLQRRALRPLVRKMDGLIVLAPFEVPLYCRDFGLDADRFTRVPNGCDLPVPSGEVVPDPMSITSIGRLDPAKGHDRVIKAFAQILVAEPRMRLTVLGKGPDEARLRGICESEGIAGSVDFKAFQADQRGMLAKCLGESGLVISMSRGETQPIAVMEAALIGCNVSVSIESPGMRDLVDARIARGIEPNLTSMGLASAMKFALENPFSPDQSGLLTWDQSVDALEELYDKVMSRRRG